MNEHQPKEGQRRDRREPAYTSRLQAMIFGHLGARFPALKAAAPSVCVYRTELTATAEAGEEGLVRRDAAGTDREDPRERAEVATTD